MVAVVRFLWLVSFLFVLHVVSSTLTMYNLKRCFHILGNSVMTDSVNCSAEKCMLFSSVDHLHCMSPGLPGTVEINAK